MSPPDEPGDARAPENVGRAADALAAGSLVGIPTETVYGIAARADHEKAVEALRALRKPPERGPLTLHFGEAPQADRFVASWLLPARRLRARYWPGPLTLVLPASQEVPPSALAPPTTGSSAHGWVALRVVGSELAREVLKRSASPIAAAVALTASGAPAKAAADLPETTRRALALALEGTRAPLGTPSTIVRIGAGRFEVEREGILTADDVRRAAGLRILLVCTGNTCRSPMAAAVLRDRLTTELGGPSHAPAAVADAYLARFGIVVESAGVAAEPGLMASPEARVAVGEIGLSLDDHRSQLVTPELLSRFDRVLALGTRHARFVSELTPPEVVVETLDPAGDVDDPFGGPVEGYRSALAQIRAATDDLLTRLG